MHIYIHTCIYIYHHISIYWISITCYHQPTGDVEIAQVWPRVMCNLRGSRGERKALFWWRLEFIKWEETWERYHEQMGTCKKFLAQKTRKSSLGMTRKKAVRMLGIAVVMMVTWCIQNNTKWKPCRAFGKPMGWKPKLKFLPFKGFSINRGAQNVSKWIFYNGKFQSKLDDLGVPSRHLLCPFRRFCQAA